MRSTLQRLSDRFSLQNAFWFVFGVIVLLSFLSRVYALGQTPVSLYWDEAAIYVDIKSVLQTGQDMHGRPWYQVIYPSYGDFKLPVYIWLATLSSWVLGLSEWSLRFPSSIVGVGTLILAGVIAKELFLVSAGSDQDSDDAKALQLMTMLVVAVSPWSVLFSRTGFEGHTGQFLFGLSVFSMLKSRQKSWWLVLAAVFGAIATYAYFSVRFVWLAVCAGVMLFLYFHQATSTKKTVKHFFLFSVTKILMPAILFFALLLPMFWSPLYEDTNRFRLGTNSVLQNEKQVILSNVYREQAGNAIFDRVLFHRLWLTAQELLKNYSDHLSLSFLFVTGDPNLRHGTGMHGVFLITFLPLFLAGAYRLFDQHKSVLLLLVGWWLVALLPAAVPENTPHALRSLNALIPLAIIIGWGGVFLLEKIRQQKTLFSYSLGSVMLIGIMLNVTFFFTHYFVQYRLDSASDWQEGYKPLTQEIYSSSFPQRVNSGAIHTYVLSFDDRFYLWLMGYGPFTGTEFRTWKSEGYQFSKSIPGVSFEEPDAKRVVELLVEQSVRVAGEKSRLQEFLAKNNLSHLPIKDVPSESGNVRFGVVELK